jgi:hypothetical protein
MRSSRTTTGLGPRLGAAAQWLARPWMGMWAAIKSDTPAPKTAKNSFLDGPAWAPVDQFVDQRTIILASN